LAYEPAVLLLDEPFSALDVKIRAQLRRTLKQIQEQLHVTTILVTHDQEEAFELGNRIGVMERGRLLEIGTPEAIYYQPKTVFAATFVGAGTVLMGQVKEGQACFGSLTLPIPESVPHVEDLSVQVLIRPEAVQLSQERPSAEMIIVGQGVLHEQTFAGAMRRVRLRLPRLQGTRQLAPPLPFGEEKLLLDALVPALPPLSTAEWWVSLDNWHILAQPNLHVLVHDSGSGSLSALQIARQLQLAFHGAVMVTAVAATAEQTSTLKTEVQKRLAIVGLEDAALNLRTGDLTPQLIEEQVSNWYDFVLVAADTPEGQFDDHLLHLVANSDAPVLLVRGEMTTLNHFLICTAVGEPGKQDVRVGGRLARRLGAKVTLFHALRAEMASNPLIENHLDQAVATLHGLGVEADSLTRTAVTPAEAIVAQAQASACDLIVLGRHGPEPDSFLEQTNIMQQVLLNADRSVLIVPEE
jgi:sulfate transport system ATP-binding protein